MKHNVEFTAGELALLLTAMNVEEIRSQNGDTPMHKKAVAELRDKISKEYLAAERRL